jgi:ribosomal protein L14E/L6E/L27E
MKNFLLIHILLFLLLMLVYQCAGAQDYVVTTRGDSLTGEVKPLSYGQEKKVQLISSGNAKTTLSLFEIRAFSSKGEIYHPVKGETGYVFMKLIQPGYLSLYAFQPENQIRFDGLFLKKIDGDNMVVPNLGFKKHISQFMADCPSVAAKVKEGELGKKDLTELVNAYNACIENRTIDHEKVIATSEKQTTKINAWDALEEKIREKDFSEKTNALEMITEIRKKIQRQEKIPNFLVEGLKNSLQETGLSQEVDSAISEIAN